VPGGGPTQCRRTNIDDDSTTCSPQLFTIRSASPATGLHPTYEETISRSLDVFERGMGLCHLLRQGLSTAGGTPPAQALASAAKCRDVRMNNIPVVGSAIEERSKAPRSASTPKAAVNLSLAMPIRSGPRPPPR
jgi:hypothetical protein